MFRQILVWCLNHRKIVLISTLACFIASISLFGLIKQEFFPASTRPELIVDLTLPERSSIAAKDEVAKQFATRIADDPTIVNYSYHVGEGIPRFILSFEPTFSKSNFVEFMIVTQDAKARSELTQHVNKLLALAGIIMRNSIILIDQIEQQITSGQSVWDAIINATIIRFRPIMLTAAAAILGMIPLVSSVFWGPMAVAIAGGLFVATILTLLVLPTMYAAWYKAKPDQ